MVETPAVGILKRSEFKDAVCYHIECDCSDSNHAIDAWIEVSHDKETPYVDVEFYLNTSMPTWRAGFRRVKAAWQVLTKGNIEQCHTLVLSEQAAINFAAAINNSVEELKARK